MRRWGLLCSLGTVGDCFDNAAMASFWARMQVELLNTRRWATTIELAAAIAGTSSKLLVGLKNNWDDAGCRTSGNHVHKTGVRNVVGAPHDTNRVHVAVWTPPSTGVFGCCD